MIISELRAHIETTLQLPIHYVNLLEGVAFPCATIRLSSFDQRQELVKRSRGRLVGADLVLWYDDYEQLETKFEEFATLYDGKILTIGNAPNQIELKLTIQDVDDDSFLDPRSGGDNWIYTRQINLNLHYEIIA